MVVRGRGDREGMGDWRGEAWNTPLRHRYYNYVSVGIAIRMPFITRNIYQSLTFNQRNEKTIIGINGFHEARIEAGLSGCHSILPCFRGLEGE